jgi:hypothetical protein
MAMGRQGDRQGDLMVTWSEMPRGVAKTWGGSLAWPWLIGLTDV